MPRRKRTPVTSLLCRGPYWLWKLLYAVSPYHRGHNAGYEQGVAAMKAYEPVARHLAEHRPASLEMTRRAMERALRPRRLR